MDEKQILIQWLQAWSKFPDVPKLENSHLRDITYATIADVHNDLEKRIYQVEEYYE